MNLSDTLLTVDDLDAAARRAVMVGTLWNIQVREAPRTVPLLSGPGLFAGWNQVRFDDVVTY